jgi:hypothetical protein
VARPGVSVSGAHVNARPSTTGILAHHARGFMFKDMTVIHKGMLPRSLLVKRDEQFGLALDEHHILPTGEMSRHLRTVYRQDTKIGPVCVERVSKPGAATLTTGYRVPALSLQPWRASS